MCIVFDLILLLPESPQREQNPPQKKKHDAKMLIVMLFCPAKSITWM